LTEYLLRWKERATKSGRFLIFQLAPWTPRTGGNATGLRPTAQGRDVKGQTQNPDRMNAIPSVFKSLYPTLCAEELGDRRGVVKKKSARFGGELTLGGLVAEISGSITPGPLSLTEKFAVRLATLSAWLMGYTAAYLAHWETASSGKSRRRSSPPSKPQTTGGEGE